MIKAGVMGAGVAIIYVMGLSLLSPFCTICLTPLLGVAVGYAAGWFDQPLQAEAGLVRGVIAGFIAGLGAVVGQMVAAVINAILMTNSENLPTLLAELGFTQLAIPESSEYWQTTLVIYSFCSAFNLALIVGLAAVGGMLWSQRRYQNTLSTML